MPTKVPLLVSLNSCQYCIAFITAFISFLHLASCTDDDNSLLFSRYDQFAYLSARDGNDVVLTDGSEYKHKDDILKLLHKPRTPAMDDPEQSCTTYLAPSSIPNSGLGMYTTISYSTGESYPFPDIGIMLQEMSRHYTSKKGTPKVKLLAQYPWAAKTLTFGQYEVYYGESIAPSLGMLANSHLGLVNIRHSELWAIQHWRDGTDSLHNSDTLTKDDVGRGGYSHHGHVTFEISANIQAGEELFVSYGDDWFTAREELLGTVPGEAQFKEADLLLQKFVRDNPQNDEDGDDTTNREKVYIELLNEVSEKDARLRAAFPTDIQDLPTAVRMGTARFSAKDSIRSIEWLEKNGACIDNIVSGVSTIPQAGRGAFATRLISSGGVITTSPVVTLEREQLYLWGNDAKNEDGSVVKELMGHQLFLNYCYGDENSSLLFFPYSPTINFINHGNKAEDVNAKIRWSTYPYHKNEWLDLSIQEIKDNLKTGLMFDIVATRDIQRGEEILLNYGTDWEESWNQHIEEWKEMMMADQEEDVDNDDVHNSHRFNMTERLGLPTAADLNNIEKHPIVRVEEEQVKNPYPSYIMTQCQLDPPVMPKYTVGTAISKSFYDEVIGTNRMYSGSVIDYNSEKMLYSILYEDGDTEDISEEELDNLVTTDTARQQQQEVEQCNASDVNGCKPTRWKFKFDNAQVAHPCTILTRTNISGIDWYTAQVEVTTTIKKETTKHVHIVEYMPRYAILFVDKPYSKDQYAYGTFRKEIGLPDGILPKQWMDLTDEE